MAKVEGVNGVWRTIGGRRVFIKDGQDLVSAMRESGKFGKRKAEYKTALDKPNKLNENGDIAEKIIQDEEINDMSVHRYKDEIVIKNERTGEKISIKPNDDKSSLTTKIRDLAGLDNDKKGKDYRDRLKGIKGKEDGTYDLDTGKKVDFGNKGYNVSFEQSTDNFTNAEYYAKIRECQTACNGKVYGGVFGGDPEISFYTEDLETAKKIMYKYNQHSIWSNELQDIIKNDKYDEKKNKTNYKD